MEGRSISFDSLREVSGVLLEMNQEVANIIVDSSEPVQKNKKFSSLIKKYMEISMQNLDLCCALESCNRRARDGQLTIRLLLQNAVDDRGGNDKSLIMKAKEELEKLRAGDDPFPEEFRMLLKSTHDGDESLLAELDKQQKEFDRTVRRMKRWTKLSTAVFAIGYFLVLILTGVTFVVDIPSPVEVLAGALSATIGSMGKWTNYYFKKKEKEIQKLKENVATVKVGTYVMLNEVGSMRLRTDKWKTGIERLLHKADDVLREEQEAEEMMKEWNVFAEIAEELNQAASRLSQDTRKWRTNTIQKIVALSSADEEQGNCLEILM